MSTDKINKNELLFDILTEVRASNVIKDVPTETKKESPLTGYSMSCPDCGARVAEDLLDGASCICPGCGSTLTL